MIAALLLIVPLSLQSLHVSTRADASSLLPTPMTR